MSVTELIGYLAAVLVFLSFYMKTMVPLRVMGICSNCAFIAYGYLGGLYPVLILHLILLPLNSLRLHQMLRLTREVREAAQGDLNLDWLRPFTSSQRVKAGDLLFSKGDVADAVYFIISGRYRLVEIGKDIVSGDLVGEIGFLAPDRSRTQTLLCVDDGEVLHITYESVKQLYYQNPQFGFYLLQLSSRRLFEDVARLEGELAAGRSALGGACETAAPRPTA